MIRSKVKAVQYERSDDEVETPRFAFLTLHPFLVML